MLQIQPKTILLGHWERNSRSNSNIKEILDELEFFKHYCHRALAISKDEDIEIHLKKQPNSCFANNYFDVDLKAWQVNTDIHIFLRMSKRQWHMCRNFSKTEDQCSRALKQAAKKALRTTYLYGTMKRFAKDYLSSPECSVQDAVYHILPELNLKKIFLALYFVNTKSSKRKCWSITLRKASYQTIAQMFSRKQEQHYVTENSPF